jgi:hypothetical protein
MSDAEKKPEDFLRKMTRVWARIAQELDQDLAAFRSEYDQLPEADKASLRSLVQAIAASEESTAELARNRARIEIPSNRRDGKSVFLSAKSLVKEIAAWDAGEFYIPEANADS